MGPRHDNRGTTSSFAADSFLGMYESRVHTGRWWSQIHEQDTRVPAGVRNADVADAQGGQPSAAATPCTGGGVWQSKPQGRESPTIKMGSSEDDFIFFQCLFESYKRSCQLTNETDIRDQLLACCETNLRRNLHRYLGTGVDNKTKVELLAEIKKIAVITRSNLVNAVSQMSAAQEHDETCGWVAVIAATRVNEWLDE